MSNQEKHLHYYEKNTRDALIVDMYFNWRDFGYVDRPTQSHIAQRIGVHSDTVNEVVRRALDEGGIAKVYVDYRGGRVKRLEQDMRRAFKGLLQHKAICVMGISRNVEIDGIERDEIVRKAVGNGAAQLLNDKIDERAKNDDVTIAVSWGRQLRSMVDAIRPMPTPCHTVHIVPTVGGFGGGDLADIESGALVIQMCHKLGFGRCYNLPAPAYSLSEQTQEELLLMPLTSDVVSRWKQASIIVSGVGSIDPKATSLALWKTSGLVPERDLPLLEQELEMVGDLSLHFFTKEGKLFPKHDDHKNSKDVAEVIRKLAYPVSASLKHLHDAATDQNRLSLAVGAGKAKAKPLFWAVINRFVSGLVIDEEAAEEMLQLHKQWLQELELRAQEIVTSAAAA